MMLLRREHSFIISFEGLIDPAKTKEIAMIDFGAKRHFRRPVFFFFLSQCTFCLLGCGSPPGNESHPEKENVRQEKLSAMEAKNALVRLLTGEIKPDDTDSVDWTDSAHWRRIKAHLTNSDTIERTRKAVPQQVDKDYVIIGVWGCDLTMKYFTLGIPAGGVLRGAFRLDSTGTWVAVITGYDIGKK
jgi:hypothetical protein